LGAGDHAAKVGIADADRIALLSACAIYGGDGESRGGNRRETRERFLPGDHVTIPHPMDCSAPSFVVCVASQTGDLQALRQVAARLGR
jgi:hypothetical protein